MLKVQKLFLGLVIGGTFSASALALICPTSITCSGTNPSDCQINPEWQITPDSQIQTGTTYFSNAKGVAKDEHGNFGNTGCSYNYINIVMPGTNLQADVLPGSGWQSLTINGVHGYFCPHKGTPGGCPLSIR